MGRLSRIYAAARRSPLGEAPLPAPEPAEETLVALFTRGQNAHPSFVVSDEAFARHLARCGADLTRPTTELRAEDLYLLCACLEGDERAVEALVSTFSLMLATTLGRLDASATFVEDALQKFWDAALVGTMSVSPRLALYSGHGALGGWLAISAQRVALMMKRHEDAEGRARRVVEETEAALDDPELVFIKQRYRESFRAATEKALETLDDRERMIFRLHLVDGVTVERIARVYGVSHSTVSRWFAGAREKVIAAVQRILREEMKISSGDFESLRRLVISQLDVSLSMLPAASS